jgi:hypothetical protein
MPSRSAAPTKIPIVSLYPAIDEATAEAIQRQLIAAVSLAHGGKLTELQLNEFKASLQTQSRALETLHRFKLTNSDEPAFTVTAVQGCGS